MASLIGSLSRLRSDFDATFPDRKRDSDGWIGDKAHQATKSDHNPDHRGLVHAIDVDKDLGDGADMQDVVDHILTECRAGRERRLTYIIFRGSIWSAKYSWRKRDYDGTNGHFEHAHFSGSAVLDDERNTRSWTLEEVPVALTTKDKEWLTKQIDAAATRAAERVWGQKLNVNVGYKGKDAAGKPRAASLQEAGDILAHLSPEGHEARDMLRKILDAAPAAPAAPAPAKPAPAKS